MKNWQIYEKNPLMHSVVLRKINFDFKDMNVLKDAKNVFKLFHDVVVIHFHNS